MFPGTPGNRTDGHRDNLQTQSAKGMVRVPWHAFGTTILVDLEEKCELSLTSPDSLHWDAAGWLRAEEGRMPTAGLTRRTCTHGVTGGTALRN